MKETEKILKEIGLELGLEKIAEENKETLENTIIKEQTPTEGIKINKGNRIFVKHEGYGICPPYLPMVKPGNL